MKNTYDHIINESLCINDYEVPVNSKDVIELRNLFDKVKRTDLTSFNFSLSTKPLDICLDKNIGLDNNGKGYKLSVHNYREDKTLFELDNIDSTDINAIIHSLNKTI